MVQENNNIKNALWLNLSKWGFNFSFRLLTLQEKRKFSKEYHLDNGAKTTTHLGSSPIESFYLNASIYDLDKFEAKRRIKKLSDMLEIDHELFIPVRKLSRSANEIRIASSLDTWTKYSIFRRANTWFGY